MMELISPLVGLVLTLSILSYVLGDNVLYRIAVHLFVGVVAGYVAATVIISVLLPQGVGLLSALLGAGGNLAGLALNLFGLLLALLLVWKMFYPGSNVGRVPVAYLVGLGTAVAVGGALTGTLLPQTWATAFALSGDLVQLASDGLIFIGTACTLLAFHYGARLLPGGRLVRPLPIRWAAYIGQAFMGLTFGVMYAGLLAASVAYLAERVNYIYTAVLTLVP